MCSAVLLLHAKTMETRQRKYIWQRPEPSKHINVKNNETQSCRASMWSCEAHMSIIPPPLRADIKELIPKKPVCFLGLLPLCPYGFARWKMPMLEVSGTNNYNQRNYNAKGTAAISAADKSLWARGDNDGRRARQGEMGKEEERRRMFLLLDNFPSSGSDTPKPI